MGKPHPITSPLDALVQGAARLSRADLIELRGAIDALVEATAPQVIDLQTERQERRAEPLQREPAKGWIENTYKGGGKYGPYQYFRWRSGSIKKSVYLGKKD